MTGAGKDLLADLLQPVRHVLLDFDGPVCSVFAGLPAEEVSRALCGDVAGADAPATWRSERDPLALLRRIAEEHPELTKTADQSLSSLELRAVASARPTSGAEAFLRACRASDRSVWVVTNNATSAAAAYLASRALSGLVGGVFGRHVGDPASMKPSPRILLDAIDAAGAKPDGCILIGDAVRDVQAGDAAGVATIGYANKPGKSERLAAAGAVAIVDHMSNLAAALS